MPRIATGKDEATAAALVGEVRGVAEQFAFCHALIRTTLYEELAAAAGVGPSMNGWRRSRARL